MEDSGTVVEFTPEERNSLGRGYNGSGRTSLSTFEKCPPSRPLLRSSHVETSIKRNEGCDLNRRRQKLDLIWMRQE